MRTSVIFTNRSGAAAAEMALIVPLLLVLMAGMFEGGNLVWNQHTLSKAVRDGARFAARQAFSNFPSANCPVAPATQTALTTGSFVTDTQNLVRTAQVTSGGQPRLPGTWTTTLFFSCSSATTGGIYNNVAGGARVIIVKASVPYKSLFTSVGFNTVNVTLNAESQAAVAGL